MGANVRRGAAVLAMVLGVAPGCGSSSRDPSSLAPESFSAPVQRALDVLSESYGDVRESTWNLSADTRVEPGWVLQTPLEQWWGRPLAELPTPVRCDARDADCDPDFLLQRCEVQADCTDGGICDTVRATVASPGQTPRKLCVGHSDRFYDDIHAEVIQARQLVDITSLSPADGRFEAALRNAITYLARAGRRVQVRLFYGAPPAPPTKAAEVVAHLSRDLGARSPVTIHVGAYRTQLSSWNHAKILAVDGERLLEGGHNFWTDHYLTYSPIHDLSMRLAGTPAVDGHRFADRLWDLICEEPLFEGATQLVRFPESAPRCPPSSSDAGIRAAPSSHPGARAVTVGRLGVLGEHPSDQAIVEMLNGATRSIRISQQDIGPIRAGTITVGDWPEPIVAALARALIRGVEVEIVVSNLGSLPGGLGPLEAGYGNGWTPEEVAGQLYEWLRDHPFQAPLFTDFAALVCERASVAVLRASPADETWPNDSGIGNHAKMFVVDDEAFYVGSQNFYFADLAEWGVVVDDAALTAELLSSYWTPLWASSARTAVSGPSAAQCFLRQPVAGAAA